MAGEWPLLSLVEAGVKLLDCEHRTPPAIDKGYPYIAIPQVKEGRLDLDSARRISRENFIDWTRKARPQQWDVILSRRCNPGETAVVPADLDCALGQNLVLLRADGNRVAPEFLRWLVRGPQWWEQVQTFINAGAVFDSLRCADIPNFRVPIPPLEDQRAIACILGTLDNKIELNHRMNETLENVARTLFKWWFVDFDLVRARDAGRGPGLPTALADLFPDSFDDSKLGEIPHGWQCSTLRDVTSKIGSGTTPRGGAAVYVDDGVALIRSQNVYDSLFSWDGLARITDEAANSLAGVTVENNDVLLNITGASILRTCIVDPDVLPARVNQHVCIIRPKPGIPSRYIHFHLLQTSTKALLMGMDAGASRQAVTKGHIESVPIVVPPAAILDTFEKLVAPLRGASGNNMSQSRNLESIRDTLLPKLISGTLRVKDAERIVESAT